MSTIEPYVEFKPGDLIAAETMNGMQGQIRQDIATQSQKAVDAITQVPRAGDADKLEGQSFTDLKKAIIDEALSQIALYSGYMKLYKKLKKGEEMVIKHGLKNCPLVDVYQLRYFRVVASEDDYKYITWVNFFLYHSSERRIQFVPETGPRESVEIESEGTPYRFPLEEMLARYNVKYTDDSNLGEIETELWDAMFAAPNDRYDDDQYTHSPWFDRCCREERTVKSLKQKGEWDDIWVKVMPVRTINYPYAYAEGAAEGLSLLNTSDPLPMPSQIRVSHFDHNSLGLKLLAPPLPQLDVQNAEPDEVSHIRPDELKVMVLLRA